MDGTATPADRGGKVRASKCFDNAPGCSSENAVVMVEAGYAGMLAELGKTGGALLGAEEKEKLRAAMWPGGKLNPAIMARPVADILKIAGLERAVAVVVIHVMPTALRSPA